MSSVIEQLSIYDPKALLKTNGWTTQLIIHACIILFSRVFIQLEDLIDLGKDI